MNLLDNLANLIDSKGKYEYSTYTRKLGELQLVSILHGQGRATFELRHPDFNVNWYYEKYSRPGQKITSVWLNRGDLQATTEALMFIYLSESF